MTDEVKATGTFYKWLNLSAEDAEKQDNRLLERRIRRELQSAFDNADSKIFELNATINSLYKGMKRNKTLDVNRILTLRAEVKSYEIAQKTVADEYLNLFGEELE